MLLELERKLGGMGYLECRRGSAERIPIDYVFANMPLHHVEEPPRAIRELAGWRPHDL